jgi:hypothetical protein
VHPLYERADKRSREVIGAAIEVHRQKGSSLIESIYERCLMRELELWAAFDDKPMTPFQWPRQPWFAEIGNVHGNGNLIVFADGSISDLKTVAVNASPVPSPK